MTVVSNTSPLRYLIAAGHADLVANLFGTVLIPRAVERELLDPHAPASVREWLARCPAWIETRDVHLSPDLEVIGQLHTGEAEAIQLALELRAEVLVMDERRGRQLAAARGLTVIGALGMLRESYRQGLIQNPFALAARLRSHGFRCSRALMRRFEEQIQELQRVRVRKEDQ
jgi:predicted nucleic acid-binding protein